METPQLDSVDLLLPILSRFAPWMVLAALTGLIAAAAFYVIAGRGFRSFPIYLVLGLAGGPAVQLGASALPQLPPPLMIGQAHLAGVALGTWALLAIARLLRL